MLTHLDDLVFFVEIVQSGTLSAAANKLNVPKSKLSRRLNSLEAMLGSQLLIRTTRKMELTDAGQLLFQQCKPHLAALTVVDEELDSLLKHPKGRLNVLFPIEFFGELIGDLIVEFMCEFPEIEICCHQYTEGFPEKLSEFDIAFVLHEQNLPATEWISRSLMSFPQSICAASNYKVGKLKKPSDLKSACCITSNQEEAWLFRHSSGIESVKVDGKLKLTSPEMRFRAVLAGLGVAKIPDYICHSSYRENELVKLELGYSPNAQELSVLYQTRSLPAKTRAFIDFFQSNIGRFEQA